MLCYGQRPDHAARRTTHHSTRACAAGVAQRDGWEGGAHEDARGAHEDAREVPTRTREVPTRTREVPTRTREVPTRTRESLLDEFEVDQQVVRPHAAHVHLAWRSVA